MELRQLSVRLKEIYKVLRGIRGKLLVPLRGYFVKAFLAKTDVQGLGSVSMEFVSVIVGSMEITAC